MTEGEGPYDVSVRGASERSMAAPGLPQGRPGTYEF